MMPVMAYRCEKVDSGWFDGVSFDVLFLAGGADPRVYEVLRLGGGPDAFREMVFFDFCERREAEASGDAYNEYCSFGIPVNRVECSVFKPSEALKSSSVTGLSLNGDMRIAVDITGLTRPYMFLLLRFLQERVGCRAITVFYTEPLTYAFPKRLFGSYRASSGSLTVVEVPSYSGSAADAMDQVLVILLGFDGALSSFVADAVSAKRTIVVNGFPAFAPKFKDISLINNERVLMVSASRNNTYYARAHSPFEVFNALDRCLREVGNAPISIAPLGPKPMALGACMYALANRSIRILYPLPQAYARKTTRDVWRSWSYEIPLQYDWLSKKDDL